MYLKEVGGHYIWRDGCVHVAMVAAVWKYAVDSLCLCLFCMYHFVVTTLSALYIYIYSIYVAL